MGDMRYLKNLWKSSEVKKQAAVQDRTPGTVRVSDSCLLFCSAFVSLLLFCHFLEEISCVDLHICVKRVS